VVLREVMKQEPIKRGSLIAECSAFGGCSGALAGGITFAVIGLIRWHSVTPIAGGLVGGGLVGLVIGAIMSATGAKRPILLAVVAGAIAGALLGPLVGTAVAFLAIYISGDTI
jgi:hypothetical protein